MPILTGTLKSVGGTPFGGPGCAVVIYSLITRPGPGKSMILELQDRIGMPAENAGVFTSGSMPSGPVRVMLEGNDVHGQAWDITLPEGEDALQLTDLVETQIDWSPVVVSKAVLAAERSEDAADRAEAGAAVVGGAQAVLAARDETVAAVATLGDAQTVLTARDEAVTAAEEAAVSANATAAAMSDKADLVDGRVPTSQIPAVALTKPQSVASRSSMLSLTDVQEGDVVIITTGDDKGSYMLGGGPASVPESWVALATSPDAPVQSVNGQSGTVVLGAGDVGAAPASHTHPVAQITDLPTISSTAVANSLVQRSPTGNVLVADTPSGPSSATSQTYVQSYVASQLGQAGSTIVPVEELPANPDPATFYAVMGPGVAPEPTALATYQLVGTPTAGQDFPGTAVPSSFGFVSNPGGWYVGATHGLTPPVAGLYTIKVTASPANGPVTIYPYIGGAWGASIAGTGATATATLQLTTSDAVYYDVVPTTGGVPVTVTVKAYAGAV